MGKNNKLWDSKGLCGIEESEKLLNWYSAVTDSSKKSGYLQGCHIMSGMQ